MLEGKLGIPPADGLPAQHPGLVAVDPVPHHLAHETADLVEASDTHEFRRPDRHLVRDVLAYLVTTGGGVISLARTGPDTRVGLHPVHQAGEISLRQIEVEVEF